MGHCTGWRPLLTGQKSVGHSFKDAIGVCAHEMNDPQLALFLCRILASEDAEQQEKSILQELFTGRPLLQVANKDFLH